MGGNPPYGRPPETFYSEGHLVWRQGTLVTITAQKEKSASAAIQQHQSIVNVNASIKLPPWEEKRIEHGKGKNG